MTRIAVSPEEFTLVKFDRARLIALAEEAAAAVGFPADVEVAIEVDEALPHPLTGSYAEVVDGRAELWFTGGSLEDPRYQSSLSEANAKVELGAALLRARDRLSDGFADATADAELSDRMRAVWDTYTEGRLARLGGFEVREPRRRYTYRLYCGFSDVADAAYARLWSADDLAWVDLGEIAARLDAADARERPKPRVARRETLRTT